MKPKPSQYFTADHCPLQVGSVIHDINLNRDVMVIARDLDASIKYFICIVDGSDVSWLTGMNLAEGYTYYPNWPCTDEAPCYLEPSEDDIKVQFVNKLFELVKDLPGAEKLHDESVWNDKVHAAIQEGAIDILNTIKEVLDEQD